MDGFYRQRGDADIEELPNNDTRMLTQYLEEFLSDPGVDLFGYQSHYRFFEVIRENQGFRFRTESGFGSITEDKHIMQNAFEDFFANLPDRSDRPYNKDYRVASFGNLSTFTLIQVIVFLSCVLIIATGRLLEDMGINKLPSVLWSGIPGALIFLNFLIGWLRRYLE